MALAMPVWRRKQSARLAATLNSPPLTWIRHSFALRKGMTPGSRRWTSAPRAAKSSAPSGRIPRPYFIAPPASGVVGARRYPAAAAGPVRMEELAVRPVDALVGVGAEEVPLRLQQVCGQTGRAEPVVEGERRGEGRRWDAGLDRADDGAPPGRLVVVQQLAEETVDEQVREPRILVVGLLDLSEEAAADDAAPAPHQGDAAEVQVPPLVLRRLGEQHVPLRVGNHLGAVKGRGAHPR